MKTIVDERKIQIMKKTVPPFRNWEELIWSVTPKGVNEKGKAMGYYIYSVKIPVLT